MHCKDVEREMDQNQSNFWSHHTRYRPGYQNSISAGVGDSERLPLSVGTRSHFQTANVLALLLISSPVRVTT